MRLFTSALAALTMLSTPSLAGISAQQKVEIEKVVENSDGSQSVTLVNADLVEPGETLFYSISYENDGTESAENVVLIMDVPREVTFVDGSASGASTVTFSADNGSTYVARGRLTVNEGQTYRSATGDDITNVKFTMEKPVAPSAKGKVAFKAILK